MAFDDTRTERCCLLAACSVLLGVTIPVYQRLTAAVAVHGTELTPFGHVKTFALSGLIAVAVLVAFCLGLAVVGWSVIGVFWVARRAGRFCTQRLNE
jgi:hypothetical protein